MITHCTDELPKWPRVLIQVASLDYWDRHRVEGCGFLDLPNTPGMVYRRNQCALCGCVVEEEGRGGVI